MNPGIAFINCITIQPVNEFNNPTTNTDTNNPHDFGAMIVDIH